MRTKKKSYIKYVAKAKLPTSYGTFYIWIFQEIMGNSRKEHVALVRGKDLNGSYVRIHSSCLTGDTFGSLRCDCGEQLKQALAFLGKKKNGILIYLDQEGRDIGLGNKIKAYFYQENGFDTYEANLLLGFFPDNRNYQAAVEILKFFGINKIKLLTNNPDKIRQLEKNGIKIVQRIPLQPSNINHFNKSYLETKKKKFNHLIEI